MHAEILSIGTELLLGQITDTNAAYLAQRLAELGIGLWYKDTVGDNPERLRETIRLAKSRSELIICTGGLGPTTDDITAEAIADVFDAPLEMREDAKAVLSSFFQRRGIPLTEKQFKQACFPRGAEIIPNPVGTAPGFLLVKDGTLIMAFPGPPIELYPMWVATAAPYLRKISGEVIHSRTLRFCGIGEAALETELQDLIDRQTTPTVAPYAKTGEVHIRLTAKAATEADAERLIEPMEDEIRRRAGKHLYGINDETLELVTGRMLRERGLTLAVAESCTGGLLGGRITNIPGSSEYFLGGVIAYSNALKEQLLGVAPAILATHGAVSEETAREMAAGVARATGADIGLSITGIAGPDGGTDEKPVGLVYLGIAKKDEPARAVRAVLGRDRDTIRLRAVQQSLVLLRDLLTGAGVVSLW